ncbi:NAD-dependent epimerase/dehydratase family protein [Marinobacter sediminum]|uniref:NAD-dependent epimerase/dehydratase family protein n=1 Tax=Marinobacter sediminum TaxID=256323 RepID=UPI00202E2F6C|nr:NAD-dependent epimerase/dehydratase family protein [Marinobacter sediminum]MCM0613816.1 NAD-dependent epimerase/dehydratase family protein [Marinobacter sediminum]
MHILITGGAGFIGSNIAEYHLKQGDKVHVVDNLSTGSLANVAAFSKNPEFRFDQADIVTWDGLDTAVAWADRIYHMAAVVGVYRVLSEPVGTMATNIAGTERLLRSVNRDSWAPQVILASSSEVYGPHTEPTLSEDDSLIIQSGAPLRWNYAISKLADEGFGLAYAREHDIPVIIARFFNTVGPRQTGRYGMVVPRFVQKAVANEPITVFGDGEQSRSFCDVRDTVVALDRLASMPDLPNGEIVNVGSDREISINELARLVIECAGSRSTIDHIPYREAYGAEFEDIRHRRPSLDKLHRFTGFEHAWNLEKTLMDLINRAREQINEGEK